MPNTNNNKKVHFAEYCCLSEIRSHKRMSEDEKSALWYSRDEIFMLRKNIDAIIKFKKYLDDELQIKNELGYLLCKKRQKKRWYVMHLVLEGQKSLTPDNLALLYARVTRREREDGIERAKFLCNVINANEISDSLSNTIGNLNNLGKRCISNESTNENLGTSKRTCYEQSA